MADNLTGKVNDEPILSAEPSIDLKRYATERCIRKNGSCYSCQVYALACPKVINALDESCKGLVLERHPNTLLTFDILDE